MNDPHRFYFVWQDNGFVDGEAFADDDAGRESLYHTICALGRKRVNWRMPAFTIKAMHMTENTLRDVTEDMVRSAYDAGYIDHEDMLFDLYCQDLGPFPTTVSQRRELGPVL